MVKFKENANLSNILFAQNRQKVDGMNKVKGLFSFFGEALLKFFNMERNTLQKRKSHVNFSN